MKRARKSKPNEWTWRLAGVMLCVFFALGLWVGISSPGREASQRICRIIYSCRDRIAASTALGIRAISPEAIGGSRRLAVALAEHKDGFYAVAADGSVQGPVSPGSQGDLPILSGPRVENAAAQQLAGYAAITVRAEAILSALISEAKINADDTASIYLRRPHTELLIDLSAATVELQRAARVMKLWRGHDELVATLDMTVADEAVMRVRGNRAGFGAERGAIGLSAVHPGPGPLRRSNTYRAESRAR